MDSANSLWIILGSLSLVEELPIFSSLVFGRPVAEGPELDYNQHMIGGRRRKVALSTASYYLRQILLLFSLDGSKIPGREEYKD